MGGLSQELYEMGIDEGYEKGIKEGHQSGVQEGIQQGIQQGIQEGKQQGMQTMIDKLVNAGLIKREDAEKQLAIM